MYDDEPTWNVTTARTRLEHQALLLLASPPASRLGSRLLVVVVKSCRRWRQHMLVFPKESKTTWGDLHRGAPLEVCQ